jgi:hypothetical protein
MKEWEEKFNVIERKQEQPQFQATLEEYSASHRTVKKRCSIRYETDHSTPQPPQILCWHWEHDGSIAITFAPSRQLQQFHKSNLWLVPKAVSVTLFSAAGQLGGGVCNPMLSSWARLWLLAFPLVSLTALSSAWGNFIPIRRAAGASGLASGESYRFVNSHKQQGVLASEHSAHLEKVSAQRNQSQF